MLILGVILLLVLCSCGVVRFSLGAVAVGYFGILMLPV